MNPFCPPLPFPSQGLQFLLGQLKYPKDLKNEDYARFCKKITADQKKSWINYDSPTGLTETTHLREENEISVCADDQSDIFS